MNKSRRTNPQRRRRGASRRRRHPACPIVNEQLRFWKETYRPPQHQRPDYSIGQEIIDCKGPNEHIIAMLLPIAERLLKNKPNFRRQLKHLECNPNYAMLSEPDGVVMNLCYQCDRDGTPIGLGPKFVDLYAEATSDASFLARASTAMYWALLDVYDDTDFGRLAATIRHRLTSDTNKAFFVERKAHHLDDQSNQNASTGTYYKLLGAPDRIVRARRRTVYEKVYRPFTKLKMPSEEELQAKHRQRMQFQYHVNDDGNGISIDRCRGCNLGKNKTEAELYGEFDRWLMFLFQTVHGALSIYDVAQVMVDFRPDLIQDGFDPSPNMEKALEYDERYSDKQDEFEDRISDRVMTFIDDTTFPTYADPWMA
ncbi:hypothetical protein [Bifidobacterium stellenboschense]|uniref:Uncharacterized protein n=1 Tax=Bifidobacterium stellenboschense TaxID=762211 RepID=A0A087DJJ4_9BIFI|nr:hypothetical protein [Bifidobacterium stellenboschense]KFI95694.1 hypothetical protein BSTEL_0500 [Bifidobacterium stellenboschense]